MKDYKPASPVRVLWPLWVLLAALAVFGVARAHADPDPMCNFSHSCGWPAPWNGQMQPTWDTPGTYGGWTTNPILCDPFTGACRVVAPGR